MCIETKFSARRTVRARRVTAVLTAAFIALAPIVAANASDLIDVLPLTDRVILLHFDDGYVMHHKAGEPRSKETVVSDPLDTARAAKPESYRVSSTGDATYKTAKSPVSVGRKTKGTDFGWIVDKYENGRTVNERPDYAAEHWLYLTLPAPMKPGKTYTVQTLGLTKKNGSRPLVFTVGTARSEAVHVNTLGYVPTAPQKFAYVYHWMGDAGGLDVKPMEGRPFFLVDAKTGKRAFTGAVRFRKNKNNAETGQITDTPNGNFLGADVAECDFSAFKTPGTYRIAVEGVGCSWDFKIGDDVYREAFRTVARGLYHNRSGIALTKPYTTFERPAPHHPKLTPGFAGKLRYTTVRSQEWGSEGGDAAKLTAASPGTLDDAWGWYQDAGDWDSYYSHLRPAQELLLTFDMGRTKFTDGELNIPESGNGVTDILDEAAWLPRFCYRLRREIVAKKYGTGGVGLRVAGDAFGTDEGTNPDGSKFGRGSWQDTDRVYMVSGEDPWSSYRYAGVAANLAFAHQSAGTKDPDGVDWAKEATETYAWAQKNTRPGDDAKEEGSLRKPRAYAAAALFRLTGDKSYEAQFQKDIEGVKPDSQVYEEDLYPLAVYALGGGAHDAKRDPATLARVRAAVLKTADETCLVTAEKRALRWGGNFYFPMLIGQQTTPWVLEGAVGYTLAKQDDPEHARKLLAALYTTCDYFLGTNTTNQTWVTGLGPRYPTEVFHMDAWYNGKASPHPGIIPYGQWRKQKDVGDGPWSSDWANKSLHPAIDNWPGNERWFNNRCSPLSGEFTIHQNTGPAAAIFGFLCADAVK